MPLSYPYGWMMGARNILYDRGLFKTQRLPRPVVCVGNLTWGGTGKTPIVRWVVEKLDREGLDVALLSRGYGRTAEGLILSPPDEAEDPHLLGDEPAMMKGSVPSLWAGICGDRWLAGNEILKRGEVDLFIMDDGFQHRKLFRDLDVVVMRTRRSPLEGRLLPAGAMREPVEGLARADVLILNETDGDSPKELLDLGRRFHCRIFRVKMVPGTMMMRSAAGKEKTVCGQGHRAVLLSGIGSPESFRVTAEAAGVVCLEHLCFPDHHWFNDADLSRAAMAFSRCKADVLLTTEKDWQRMRSLKISLPTATLGLEVRFREGGDEALLELIRERL